MRRLCFFTSMIWVFINLVPFPRCDTSCFYCHSIYTGDFGVRKWCALSLCACLFYTWLMGSIRWMGRCWSTERSGLLYIYRLLCWDFIVFFIISPLSSFLFIFPLTFAYI
ncbi:hypothetical protein HDV62DRAFT_323075 [Trichoderma sp. SZMC 28011]